MKALLRVACAPMFAVGFVGVAVCMIGSWRMPLWSLLPLLAVAVTCAWLAEHFMPYERDWNRSRGDGLRDGMHAVVNESLSTLGVAFVPLLAAIRPWPSPWPAEAPLWLQLVIAIVVADAGITLAHWASHRYGWLWRLHAVHHSVARMYGLNGLMKHPLHQAIEALAGTLPLLLCGMTVEVAALLAFSIAIQLLLQHGNVDMRPGPFGHLFCWAPLHRFHHIKYGSAGDVNFGLFLTVWDRLLGTAVDGQGYRIGPRDLGIGGRPDYPTGYGGQLIEPFRSSEDGVPPPLPAALAQSIGRSCSRDRV